MRGLSVISKFPVFKGLSNKEIFKSISEVTYDHSFDDSRVLFYRILDTLPSSHYSEIKPEDFDKVIDFLKKNKFELLTTSANVANDETNFTHLINVEKKIVLKLYYVYDTFKQEKTDEVDEVVEVSSFEASLFGDSGFPDQQVPVTAIEDDSNSEFSCYLCYHPSPENFKFIEEYTSLLTKDDPKKENLVHMFEKDFNGKFRLTPYKIEGFDIDIEKHYNDDFKQIDENIKRWCGDFKTINKRLVMLEGVAGTGKTNYIKHILSIKPDIRKIYVPPYYIEAIADPGFFSFIKRYTNSILILEDSEKVLVSRDVDSGNSGISILLNLTDGILASVLNFKIICTFNTNDKEIDPALKRKGRLFTRYHFDKLSPEKTTKLFKEIYDVSPPESSMSLGDIYNQEDNGIAKKEEKKIGFGS